MGSPEDPQDLGSAEQREPVITVTNEFTSVRVQKVRTGAGERLEISSLRVPRSIRLDPLVLESLIWRPFEDLAKGLETPFGVDVDAADRSAE
jgi:hypothetical protein